MTDIIEQIIYDIKLEIGISGLESYVCKDGTEIKTDVGAVYDWFSEYKEALRRRWKEENQNG